MQFFFFQLLRFVFVVHSLFLLNLIIYGWLEIRFLYRTRQNWWLTHEFCAFCETISKKRSAWLESLWRIYCSFQFILLFFFFFLWMSFEEKELFRWGIRCFCSFLIPTMHSNIRIIWIYLAPFDTIKSLFVWVWEYFLHWNLLFKWVWVFEMFSHLKCTRNSIHISPWCLVGGAWCASINWEKISVLSALPDIVSKMSISQSFPFFFLPVFLWFVSEMFIDTYVIRI